MQKYKNFLLIILAFIAGSFISLATTLALAHGGDTNLIHSCYKTNTGGSFRIVGTNDNCDNNETALDWSRESQQPIWGNIVGTLSNQTDLQNALDAKQDQLVGINDKHHKASLTNNANNDLLTFPLAIGEGMGLSFEFVLVAKKGSDWGVSTGHFYKSFYNDSGVLQQHQLVHYDNFDNGGVFNTGSIDTDASLSSGVVTFKINPNVANSPDSVTLDYVIINPSGKPLTFL